MAGQKGRDLLVQLKVAGDTYLTLAGIRTSEIRFDSTQVDTTTADNTEAWRTLLGAAGTKSARISGAGVFKDSDSDVRMRAIFFAGDTETWRFVMPGLGQLEGAFQITGLRWFGRFDGEAEFDVTLESAGLLTFEAV